MHDLNVVCTINCVANYLGGIAGTNFGLIENCTVTTTIVNEDGDYTGGICGYNADGSIVRGCHVMGTIQGKGSASCIGGICGYNYYTYSGNGEIYNCWVEADVSSEHYNAITHARLGGICGFNTCNVSYCCMTGNVTNTGGNSGVGGIIGINNTRPSVSHCTFYGTVTVNHDQASKYCGNSGSVSDMYDTFQQSEYDDAIAAGHTLYAQAIKYPYTINVKKYGPGELRDIEPRGCPGQTISLTVASGKLDEITVRDAVGNDISLSGNATDGYTFTMPKKNVKVLSLATGTR
ncbi:MAG: hypothetical protein J5913_06355 [Prevotella sp.]|nr:hypothetical protein [Prevotella sp.]MBO6144970.1 hypothetical protein [Prevotella sp.]MBP3251499.1 hypothetical protein [Prevotella sp.]